MGLALTLFAPSISSAAIAYGSLTNLTECGGNNITTCTYTNVTVSGTNPVLICFAFNETNNPGVVTATWNGSFMTEIGTQQSTTFGVTAYFDTFYIAAPASGNKNLVFNTTNAMAAGNGFYGTCMQYTGVSQTAPIDTNIVQHTTGTVTSDSLTVSSVANNDWMVGIWGMNAGRTCSAGAGTTLRGTFASTVGCLLDSNAPITPAGSYTLNVNLSGSDHLAGLGFDIIPFASTPPSTTTFLTGYAYWW